MGNANNKSKKRLKSVMAKDTSSEKKRRPKKYKIEEKDKNIPKSLSDNKLIKLPYNENNHEEALPNSLDTNFSSTKSNTNEALEEEEFEDNISQNGSEEEDNKNNKELIITNNIKKVFIESKPLKEETISKLTVDIQNEELNSQTSTFDYELNIFRDSEAVRQSYMSKLISKNIWNPSMKPKQHNSLIIFDWDDTLLPTTFLTSNGGPLEDIKLSDSDFQRMKEIENHVYLILKESIEKGDVYIITNAGENWVQFSSSIFYPNISELLKKIKIISN